MQYSLDLLRELSLIVVPCDSGPYKGGYLIAQEARPDETDYYNLFLGPGLTNPIKIVETHKIFPHPHNERWVYERWELTPGPGPDDVSIEIDTLAQAIEICYHALFGKPVEIDDWIFPIHRHPEWQRDKIERLVREVVAITMDQWTTIKEEMKAYRHSCWINKIPVTLADHYRTSFVEIEHRQDPVKKLQLRRDLKIAYIVCDMC